MCQHALFFLIWKKILLSSKSSCSLVSQYRVTAFIRPCLVPLTLSAFLWTNVYWCDFSKQGPNFSKYGLKHCQTCPTAAGSQHRHVLDVTCITHNHCSTDREEFRRTPENQLKPFQSLICFVLIPLHSSTAGEGQHGERRHWDNGYP